MQRAGDEIVFGHGREGVFVVTDNQLDRGYRGCGFVVKPGVGNRSLDLISREVSVTVTVPLAEVLFHDLCERRRWPRGNGSIMSRSGLLRERVGGRHVACGENQG